MTAHPILATWTRRLNDATWPDWDTKLAVMSPLTAAIMDTADLDIDTATVAVQTVEAIKAVAVQATRRVFGDDKAEEIAASSMQAMERAARFTGYAEKVEIYKASVAIILAEIDRARKAKTH